jgi:subtilisin family serine protease
MYRYAAVLLVVLSSLVVQADPGVIGRAKRPIKNSYIVVLNEPDTARPSQRAAELAKRFGFHTTAVWENVLGGFAAEMTEAQALALSHSGLVKSISEDAENELATTQTTDSAHWGLDRIDQHLLPYSGTYTYCQDGSGVDIYVVDTGTEDIHPDFDLLTGGSNRVTAGADFCTTCTGTSETSPCLDHGTQVASVAIGLAGGVAKNAEVIPVRVATCYGSVPTSWAISGFDWVVMNHQANTPAVMNVSFTVTKDLNDTDTAAVTDAIQDVVDDGVFVVVAAGNNNEKASNTLLPNIDTVFTAGGSDRFDHRWSTSSTGSNFGSKVDAFAPARSIPTATGNSTYASADGTSLAAPFVAGVAAQYLQFNPSATPAQVFSWLVSTATTGVLSADPNLGVGSPDRLLYSTCN